MLYNTIEREEAELAEIGSAGGEGDRAEASSTRRG